MSRPRSRIADYLVYLLARLLVCVVQALPIWTSYRVAALIAWMAYHVDRRHRRVAYENLRYAFPERCPDAARSDALVRAVYRHFCTLLIEIMHTPRRLHASNWRKYVELPAGHRNVEGVLSGRPLLFVTGHFGNWEMGGYILGLLGFTTHAIARTLDNPYLDQFLRRFREQTGQKILDKNGDFNQIQAVLDRGGVLATLGDQDAGPKGLFVDFFGRPASTHKAVALLSLNHRVPLMIIGTPRVGEPMRYQVVVEDVIYPEDYENQPDAVRAMTQRFTDALERLIRRHPEQYLWLHRRWKHRPAPRRRPAQAPAPNGPPGGELLLTANQAAVAVGASAAGN